jgi:formate dehydrogenase iron-sulfur subunit
MTNSAPVQPGHSRRVLIDELLAEQQQLTAVDRFARRDAAGLPAQERYYRALIPLQRPRAGEQYAFRVDLDACTGCKACVSACHSLNGLDDDEVWRTAGLLHGGDENAAYQQTITTACHHCLDPACLNGCPVKAYEKDPETGIVRHLDDQCIGCRYCVLKCPYDVPKYSKTRGIVRKCDLCYHRLAVDEAPACVQACPNEAISIQLVRADAPAAVSDNDDCLLPGTFPSNYTKPTTRYLSGEPIPANARGADSSVLRLEDAHWPLVFMLVCTQMAAGLFLVLACCALFAGAQFSSLSAPVSLLATGVLLAGLAISVLHLGRPLGAWRAFLGLRTSWMSREIVVFGMFAGTSILLVVSSPGPAHFFPVLPAAWAIHHAGVPVRVLALVTCLWGLLGVYCSAMVYVDTRRAFWSKAMTFPKFFGTTLLLGSGAAACVLAWNDFFGVADLSTLTRVAATVAMLVRTALFVWEGATFHAARVDRDHANHLSAMTIWSLQRGLLRLRMILFLISSIFGLLSITHGGMVGASCGNISLLATVASQIMERYLFFTAVIAPRMPGGIAA